MNSLINDHSFEEENVSTINEETLSNEKLIAGLDSLKVSDFLRIIEQGDDLLLYHTLFGMPIIVPKDFLELIDLIKNNKLTESDISEEDLDIFKQYYFIVPKGLDEREVHANLVKEESNNAIQGKNIEKLDLLISEACNFGCSHCIYFSSMDSGDSNRANKIMKIEQAKNTVDEYVKILNENGKTLLNIHFGAAEPLLNWKTLKDIILYIKNQYPNYEYKLSLNTNLSLLTQEMAEFFKENRVEINVSLDGNKESNDSIRTLKNGKGTYDIITEKMNILKSIDYPLTGISLIITAKNYHLVDIEFVHWCKDMGFTSLAFDIDLLNAISIEGVDIKGVSEKMVNLYKECDKLGIEGFGTWITPFLNIKHQSVLDGEIPYFCSAVKGKSIAVSGNGDTTTCSYTTTKIGKIDSILFGVNSEIGKLISSRTPGVNSFCNGCSIEGHCAGQCHATREVAQAKSNIEILPKMCDFYRTTTKLLLEYEIIKS